MTTIRLPEFSGRPATRSAASTAAPDEKPTSTPSCRPAPSLPLSLSYRDSYLCISISSSLSFLHFQALALLLSSSSHRPSVSLLLGRAILLRGSPSILYIYIYTYICII